MPIPMYLLVDAPAATTVDQVLALAGACFGHWLTVTGTPELE